MTPNEAGIKAVGLTNEDLLESVLDYQYQAGCDQYGPPDVLLFAMKHELNKRLQVCGFLPSDQLTPVADDELDARARELIMQWKARGAKSVGYGVKSGTCWAVPHPHGVERETYAYLDPDAEETVEKVKAHLAAMDKESTDESEQ